MYKLWNSEAAVYSIPYIISINVNIKSNISNSISNIRICDKKWSTELYDNKIIINMLSGYIKN